MTPDELSSRICRHNWKQAFIAICAVIVAVPMWVLMFSAIRLAVESTVTWLQRNLGMHTPIEPATVGLLAAVFAVAAIAIAGFRYSGVPFDLADFRDSPFDTAGNVRSSGQLASTWFYLQIFLIAPFATNAAIQAIRSRISAVPELVERSADLLCRLKGDRRWVTPTEFGECGPELKLLRRLNLIWLRSDRGKLAVRYPAGLKPSEMP
jgi:hypothetical protein